MQPSLLAVLVSLVLLISVQSTMSCMFIAFIVQYFCAVRLHSLSHNSAAGFVT
jgi:F0F1-type ATP synthase assembly protein I